MQIGLVGLGRMGSSMAKLIKIEEKNRRNQNGQKIQPSQNNATSCGGLSTNRKIMESSAIGTLQLSLISAAFYLDRALKANKS